MPRLLALPGPDSPVGDVRGRGAMLAMEFVRAGHHATRLPSWRARSPHSATREGVLTLVCGTFGNVIRLLPPLVIGMDLLDDALDVLEAAVATVRVGR